MASHYTDANGVFHNKFGIADSAELKAAEYKATANRRAQLESGAVDLKVDGFGLDRLKAIHGHLFQDVYAWAGQPRETHSSKRAENGMTSVFARPEDIAPNWTALAEKTNAFATAKEMPIEQQRAQLLDAYVEANRVHAFPEGNGRSLQTFMSQLARTQGLDLDFSRTTARDWNLASAVSGTHGRLFEHVHLIPVPPNREPLRKIFDDIVRPERAIAFEKWPEPQAIAKFPELRGAFEGLRAVETRAQASMSGDTARVSTYVRLVREEFVARLDKGQPLEQRRQVGQGNVQDQSPTQQLPTARDRGRDR